MAQAYRSAQLSYTEMFTADELIVEFDGNTYLLANKGNGEYGSGNLPTSINPIGIIYADGVNTMYVSIGFSGGDHHVVIKEVSSSIETTECFKKAVKSIGGGVMMLNFIDNGTLSIEGATWQEAYDALTNGTMVYLNYDGQIIPCVSFGNAGIGFSHTYVDDVVYTDEYIWKPNGSVINNSTTYPPQQAG